MTDLLLEEVARALLLLVRTHLNTEIDQVWDEMEEKDETFFTTMGQPVPVTPKVYPANDEYHLGHHPTLLEWPVDKFPVVTVASYQHEMFPGALGPGLDQIETLGNRAYVEAFVRHDDESTVNRTAWRYAKALHRVVTEHKDLDSWPMVFPIAETPEVQVSNAFARRIDEFVDRWTYLQGVRLEYVFRTPQPW